MHSEQDPRRLGELLAGYLATHTGRATTVEAVRPLSRGWESDVYAVSAPGLRDGMDVLALRVYFGAQSGATAVLEARALRVLAAAGYPVPQVVWVEPRSNALGRPFLLMEYVAGEPLGVAMRSTDSSTRTVATARFCTLFAQLHALEWARIEAAQELPRYTLREVLDTFAGYARRFPSAAFDATLGWLYTHVDGVSPAPPALIHFDFHPFNILVNEHNEARVIDWTQCQITDPRLDLAWTMTLVGSERGRETAAALRDGYAAAARQFGATLRTDELAFFEAVAAARRLLSVLLSLDHGAEALGMRPGAETTMTGYLPMIANVYRRWLELTSVALPDAEEHLAGLL